MNITFSNIFVVSKDLVLLEFSSRMFVSKDREKARLKIFIEMFISGHFITLNIRRKI